MTGKTIAEALREATQALAAASETPRLDAELLMADALGIDRGTMLLMRTRDAVPDGFAERFARRMAHEPVAYITGRQDFWTLSLAVSPAVLIPRSDSETLIEAALEVFAGRAPQHILDLGTGSGALLLAALSEFPQAMGTGIDASESALVIARANAETTGFSSRAQMLHGDWRHDGWTAPLPAPFDLILANPPYIEADATLAPQVGAHEPHSALFAGTEGLDDYRILIPALPSVLAQGGVAIFEIGFNQCEAVSAIAMANGFDVQSRRDLAGHDRALILRGGRSA